MASQQRQQIARENATRKLLDFTKYTKPNYKANWHHKHLCEKLDKFAKGEIKRLMVFMPPRHGKSELVSRRLPAFLLGKNPDCQLISASYGADLASQMNRDVQRIIDNDKYREVFPETLLSSKNVRTTAHQNYLRNSEQFEVVNKEGSYKCAGVGGALTGMGGDYIIIDDPIKNQEEADSPTYREKVWNWYNSVILTRLESEIEEDLSKKDEAFDGSILLTMTRWHEDDLAGRLLKLAEENPEADQWEVISFPAIIETELEEENCDDPRIVGEALWPQKYNEKKMRAVKASSGTRVWASLFQQRPSPDKGDIVERGWWRYWSTLPAEYDHLMISVDCAFKGTKKSDYVVIQVWMKKGARKYLVDQTRAQIGFTATQDAIRQMKDKYPEVVEILIEEAANGPAIIETLSETIEGIIPFNPRGGKESRAKANAVSPQIEAGNVYLPSSELGKAWVNDYIEEWAVFPNGANDDQVDATSQALIRMHNDGFGWIQVLEMGGPQQAGLPDNVVEQLWPGMGGIG